MSREAILGGSRNGLMNLTHTAFMSVLKVVHFVSVTTCSDKVANVVMAVKCKAIPIQAYTCPRGYRRLRLPHFKTTGTGRW